MSVERSRSARAQTLELLAFELEFALLRTVFRKHRTVGVDDDDVLSAVDD